MPAGNYYDPQGPSSRWAGTGRRQRQAQRQRVRGAGMGALGDDMAARQDEYARRGTDAMGMQRDVYGGMGGVADQMGGLASAYGDLAAGRGRSLAQAQLRQATSQNVANQMAMAAAGRGGNLAAQARQAGAAGSAAQMGAQQQAAQLRAQEQQAAMAGQAGALQGQAGIMGQQAGVAGEMAGLAGAQEMGYGQLQLEHQLGHRGQDIQAQGDRRQFASGLVDSIGGAIGSIGSLFTSDERAKKNVRDGGLAAVQAVGELEPKTFEYRPGFGAPGQRVGVMAQQLEQSPAGQAIVHDTPLGKQVDAGGLASLATAAAAEQQKEIDRIKRAIGLGGG